MIIRVVVILLLLCGGAIAQEDVCEGVTEFTITQGDSFAMCWDRNPDTDYVDEYRVHKSSTSGEHELSDPVIGVLKDDACLTTTCHLGSLTEHETGTHYLIVRAYDDQNRWSGPSNEVILIVKLNVLPVPPQQLKVTVVN